MRFWFILALLLLLALGDPRMRLLQPLQNKGRLGAAQHGVSSNSPAQKMQPADKASRKLDASITKQQQLVDRLERELIRQRGRLEDLEKKRTSPEAAKAASLRAAGPIVLSLSTSVFLMNGGKSAGFRNGDHLVFIRHTKAGVTISGQGEVIRVYTDDLEGEITSGDVQPEDEGYISNRSDTYFRLSRLRF